MMFFVIRCLHQDDAFFRLLTSFRFPGNPPQMFVQSTHGMPPTGHYITPEQAKYGIESGQLVPSGAVMNMHPAPPAHMQMIPSHTQQGHFMIPSPQHQHQQQSFHHPQHPPMYYHNQADIQRPPGSHLLQQRGMAVGAFQGNSLAPPFIPQQQQQQLQIQMQQVVTPKATRTEDTVTYPASRPSESSNEAGPDVSVVSSLPIEGTSLVSVSNVIMFYLHICHDLLCVADYLSD
jgi:hypothetical protein